MKAYDEGGVVPNDALGTLQQVVIRVFGVADTKMK